MASADVGKLRVVLAAETDRFNKQMQKSRKATGKLSKQMRGTAKSANAMGSAMGKLAAMAGGALGARAIFNLAKKYTALGDEIAKTSKRLGINIETLQALQIEGKAAGIETEQLNKALAKLGVNIGEVAAGLGTEFTAALDRLDIKLRDIGGHVKPISAILVEFAVAVGRVTDQNERLALAADAFGVRAGPRMLEVLPIIAKGMDAVTASASKLATITGGDAIKALEAQQDALDRLGKAWDAFFLARFGGLAIQFGFGSLEAQTRREIEALELLHPWLLRLSGSTDKLTAARARLAALGDAAWRGAAGRGEGIFALPPALPQPPPGRPEIPSEMADFMAGQAAPQIPPGLLEATRQLKLDSLNWAAIGAEWDAGIDGAEATYSSFAASIMTENEVIETSVLGMTNSFASHISAALMSGKLDFAEFARSAVASIVQIITQQLLLNAIMASPLGGIFGAKQGAVVPGGVETFAQGGVVHSPTMFAMGGSGRFGLMAEAGSEAIMPLRRDSKGRLGVSATGGAAGAGVVVNVTNNAQNSRENDARLGRTIADQVRAAWNAEARRQIRPGGTLNPIGSNV